MLGPSREIPRAVRLLKGDDSVAIAEVGPVCVVIWRGAVTEAPFELQRAALARVVDRNPGTAGMLCIVENSAKPPGDKLRSASTDMITRHGTNLKCLGCVIEGTGFMTAVHRGALAGMVLLLRNKKTSVSIFATNFPSCDLNSRPPGGTVISLPGGA